MWQMPLSVGMISRLQTESSDSWWASLCLLLSSAQTQEQDTQGVSWTPCCSSSFTACVMMFISLQANTENIRVVRGSQPAKLVVLSQVIGITVQPAVQHPSTETLCCFLCLSSQCRSVHWCHLVFKRLITWPEGHNYQCGTVKVDQVINEVFHSGGCQALIRSYVKSLR